MTEESARAVTINTALSYTLDELEHLVVKEIADSVVLGKSLDDDGNEHRYRNDAHASLVDAAREVIKERTVSQVDAILTEALKKPIQRYDDYGNKRGEPTTLEQLIVERAEKWLTETTGDYNRRQTRIDKLISEAVDYKFSTELNKALADAKAKVLRVVREKAAEALSETLQRAATAF
jgi:cobalamin biosynthesis Mg chelatase CobN